MSKVSIETMIDLLRFKAENIKSHIEPEFFNDVADELEKYQWIDAEDRLPEDDEDVLIYSQNGIMYIGWYFDEEWQTDDSDIYNVDVIAWMPLPEPYKKEVE